MKTKKIYFGLIIVLFTILLFRTTYAETPSQFQYQAVLRDLDGSIMANQEIGVKVEILQGTTSGAIVFTENHNVSTSSQGIINLAIGSVNTDGIEQIEWHADEFFIRISVNENIMGVSKLLGVPYAMHSKSSETITGELPETDPVFSAWDKSTGITISESQISDFGNYLETETQGLSDVIAINNSVNGQIKNLHEPTDDQDAVTKAYVDNLKSLILDLYTQVGVSDINGNSYNVVRIGNQVWMSENLKTTHFRNGDPITTGLSDTDWQNATSGAYSVYDYSVIDGLNSNEEVLNSYGVLYNWYAVSDPRGICPATWRIPTNDDFTELISYIGGTSNGASLKSTRTEPEIHPRWNSPNEGATDLFSFKALPAGTKLPAGNYYGLGYFFNIWSSTETSNDEAFRLLIYTDNVDVNSVSTTKELGFSVRCIKVLD